MRGRFLLKALLFAGVVGGYCSGMHSVMLGMHGHGGCPHAEQAPPAPPPPPTP